MKRPTIIWKYASGLVVGCIESDGVNLTSRFSEAATGLPIGQLLLPYRLLSRDRWHGEAREMPHAMVTQPTGFSITWPESKAHPVRLTMHLTVSEEDVFDITFRAEVQQRLTDYELFQSFYFAREFRGGGYVHALPYETPHVSDLVQVQPVDDPLYREMYLSFPRDERSAAVLCDGRWQRGRHFTRFLPARYYGIPLGYFASASNGIGIAVMGRQDVFAVSMAYNSADVQNSVGQHNSLYLSLLGRTVSPGETVNTGYRMVVGRFGRDARSHLALYEAYRKSAG